MNRIVAGIAVLLFVIGLGACSGQGSLSQEQVDEAFVVSFSAIIMGSMAAAFGSDLEGVSLDQETGELTLDGFDISELETDYTAISGSARGDGTTMTAELTLAGGAVQSLSYELGDISESETIETTVTANGREYEINLGPDSLGM